MDLFPCLTLPKIKFEHVFLLQLADITYKHVLNKVTISLNLELSYFSIMPNGFIEILYAFDSFMNETEQ